MRRLQISATALAVIVMLFVATGYSQVPVRTADANKRGLTDKDFPHVVKLANNVYAVEVLPPAGNAAAGAQERVTTNSMVIVTTDGVMVVDGQGSVGDATKLIDEIKKITNQPIKYVVVSSEHGDHTGGLSAFPSTATFISHPLTKATFEAQAAAPARGGNGNTPRVVVPTETVSDKRTIKMGNTEIQLMFLGRTHTAGMLEVYLPQQKILWMSEGYNHHRFPTLRTGYPSEWIATLKKAEAMDVQYYAGAHGFIDDAKTMKADLPEYRKALESVFAETKRLYKPGANVDEAYKQANFGPYASWTSSGQQAETAFKKVWEELDGKLK
jgi:glyoxylase-like metal-dependent hydrolase (beta-lactamase superfamily II)